jgi:SAM-dependent methyltransferase
MLRSWLWAARARRQLQRAFRPLGPVDATIAEHAPGASFADVGALWEVHGRTAFLAEEHGATAVTAIDVSGVTPEFEVERERKGSAVRFVQGDIHDPAVLAETGTHDVVWCSGVLYHCPNPAHTIDCLRRITGSVLVLISASIPEFPGLRNNCVFFPGLSDADRRAYDRAYNAASGVKAARVGLTTPFDPAQGLANWWWGLSPSAIASLLEAAGFDVVETKSNGFHTRVVARVS